jgi:hypothetical protein
LAIHLEILWSAVSAINSLKSTSGAKGDPLAKVNDPRSLVDAPEFWRAFSSAGHVDLDGTLLATSQIQDEAISRMARLATCEQWLTAGNEQ